MVSRMWVVILDFKSWSWQKVFILSIAAMYDSIIIHGSVFFQ